MRLPLSWSLVATLTIALAACTAADTEPLARAADFQLARSGDVDAMHRLCFDYTYGERGLPQDHLRARVWCAAAAERGNPSCQTLYAQLLGKGEGGPRDVVASARWYRLAADQGHIHARYMLGMYHLDGVGVPRDVAKGDSLLRLAADSGLAIAAEELRRRAAERSSQADSPA